MEFLRGMLSAVVGGTLSRFAGRDPMISLLPLSILTGGAVFWCFSKLTGRRGIREIRRKIRAHFYELRLFSNEPALLLRAQWGLLVWNLRYMARMLVPALIVSVPMLLVFPYIDSFYGYDPLQVGQPALVTLRMATLQDTGAGVVPRLRAPDGIEVESPPVSVDGGREFSWRICPKRPLNDALEFALPSGIVTKTVQAGAGPRYLSERRVSSRPALLLEPAEPLLPPGAVDSIEIRYPKATIRAIGLDLPWEFWFAGFSLLSALLIKAIARFPVSR